MQDKISLLNNLYLGLKFKDATYSEKRNICVANFLYNPEFFKPNDENKIIIMNKLNEIVGDYVKYELAFINCPLDKRAIASHAYTTIVNNFPALSKNFTFDDVSIDINSINVTVSLKLIPTIYEYAKGLDREHLVADKLKESFFADFIVLFELKDDDIPVEINLVESNMELMESIKQVEDKITYQLTNITDIIGKNEYTLAMDFSKISSPIENVIICGEVTSVARRTYKRNYTKKGETTEIERTFYNFSIKNNNKIIYCSIFPRQADEVKGDLIEVGMKVCCLGSFKEFNGKLNFTAISIARCNYQKDEIKTNFKQLNEQYHTVFPTDYLDYEQKGLFDEDDKIFEGDYVVFDVETTGLDPIKDEIIEVGACKVSGGKIIETFSSFVKPSRHIPREITELTGITDGMVENAPTINYIMPDFYKFCNNASLVAHNISFDISFVNNIAKKLSYNFDHQLIDTIELAKSKLLGLKNYRLGTVVEKLDILLENAHRAIHDAVATAKVFIKLM